MARRPAAVDCFGCQLQQPTGQNLTKLPLPSRAEKRDLELTDKLCPACKQQPLRIPRNRVISVEFNSPLHNAGGAVQHGPWFSRKNGDNVPSPLYCYVNNSIRINDSDSGHTRSCSVVVLKSVGRDWFDGLSADIPEECFVGDDLVLRYDPRVYQLVLSTKAAVLMAAVGAEAEAAEGQAEASRKRKADAEPEGADTRKAIDEEVDASKLPDMQGVSTTTLAEWKEQIEAELQRREAAFLNDEGRAALGLPAQETTEPVTRSLSAQATTEPAFRSLSSEPYTSLSAADEPAGKAGKADAGAEAVYALLEQADENLEYGALWAVELGLRRAMKLLGIEARPTRQLQGDATPPAPPARPRRQAADL